jgi:hypothetical protein
MTTTRWKLTAGGLVLALGGLAAVAGVPASSCQPDHKAGPAVLVEVPVAPVAYQTPTAPQSPATPAIPTTPEPTLPAVSTPAELRILPSPVVTAEKKSEPKPAPKENKVFELAVPAEEVKPAAVTPPSLPSPEPKPAPAPPLPVTEVPAQLLPSPEPSRPAAVQPTPASADPLLNASPTDTPPVVEKKLKVMLHMGDDRPRFEVRDGDEVYLKVVCDKVDVKSPSDRGENMSTLRATGRVTFVTPGGEGTCEELTVIPGTGQVVVAGRVSFKYNWGKVETTVSGDKMTFRLGSTPGVAPTTVQATHRTR